MIKIQAVLMIVALLCGSHSAAVAQGFDGINYDSLKRALEAMYDADQNIRRILVDSIGLDSPLAGKYINQMAQIDAKNKAEIEQILEKYGWIAKSKVGEKASEAIFYAVQHTDLKFIEKYFPQFRKLAQQGEANLSQSAMMEDRLLMWQGKKQLYGTQASGDLRPDRKAAVWPIEDPAKVNERRRSVGFKLTVEENAKRLNAEYDPNEKLPGKKN